MSRACATVSVHTSVGAHRAENASQAMWGPHTGTDGECYLMRMFPPSASPIPIFSWSVNPSWKEGASEERGWRQASETGGEEGE
eukprot:1499439-Rhodomonas_salina.1